MIDKIVQDCRSLRQGWILNIRSKVEVCMRNYEFNINQDWNDIYWHEFRALDSKRRLIERVPNAFTFILTWTWTAFIYSEPKRDCRLWTHREHRSNFSFNFEHFLLLQKLVSKPDLTKLFWIAAAILIAENSNSVH